MVDRDKRIGEIAYRLWEEAGKPHGQDQHFWHVAVEQYEAEIGVTGQVPAEKRAAEPKAPASKAEPKAPAPKKHAPAKAKAVATEPAAKPEEPKPDAKVVAAEPAAKPEEPKPDAKVAKDDKPKPAKAKAKKTKDDGAPLTASWIKSEATASPKGGKRKS